MGRRRQSGLDEIASLPWPFGIAFGVAAWLGIQYGLPWWFGRSGDALGLAIAKQFGSGTLAPLAWVLLGLCWFAAFISWLGSRQRRKLLDAQTGLDSFAALGWRHFEQLVGEAYRRQGYAVQETGQGGADGGVDLILRKAGRTTLVQVKQWRRRKVDVPTVREMFGLMTHHDADAVRIAALGGFTGDAQRFASGKAIELIDGPALLALVRSGQSRGNYDGTTMPALPKATGAPNPATTPFCPRCHAEMVKRHNRKTHEPFWGCPSYPKCGGTRPA